MEWFCMHCLQTVTGTRIAGQLPATAENIAAVEACLKPELGQCLTIYTDKSDGEKYIEVFLCTCCRQLLDLQNGKVTKVTQFGSVTPIHVATDEEEDDELQEAIEASLRDTGASAAPRHGHDISACAATDEDDAQLRAAIEASLQDMAAEGASAARRHGRDTSACAAADEDAESSEDDWRVVEAMWASLEEDS